MPPTTSVITPPQAPPDDAEAFFTALRASRLVPDGDVDLLKSQLQPGELPALFDLLVAEGALTPYQLDRVRRGEGRGLVVGPYRVTGRLGGGGGGEVYEARHAVMNRLVALKVITPAYTEGDAARDHFRREVAATTGLRHPNIVLVYDANEADGVLYLAMELIPGPTLQAYVADRGAMPVSLACGVVRETARALDHAHRQGLVHRDIKPANILLPGLQADGEGRSNGGSLVKVVDFGLARFTRHHTTISCPRQTTLGTPAFMAPEQIRDVHAADIRSDLYGLGCCFYYALTGHLPFEGGSLQATLLQHLSAEPRPIRVWRPEVPAALAAIVQRMMAKNPAARFQTPAELIDALTAFLYSGDPDEPARVSGTVPAVAAERPTATAVAEAPTRPPAPDALPAFRRLWREWVAAVADTVRPNSARLAEADYRTLYRDVIAAADAARGSPGLPDGLLDRARELAAPWVTLAAIDSLDSRSRVNLYRACREVDTALSPAGDTRAGGGWLAPGA